MLKNQEYTRVNIKIRRKKIVPQFKKASAKVREKK